MYVVVGGAGEVGYHVARALRNEGHDVAVIDRDPARVDRLQDLDVLTVQGNMASRTTLEEARIQEATLFLATSGDDEVNLVASALAKTYGCRTICRLNDPDYLNVPYSDQYKAMGVDVAVSPEMVAAIRIKRMLNQPSLLNADVFAQGKVLVAEGRVTEDAFVIGKKVGEVEPPAGFNLFAIYRGDDVFIPRGHNRFQVHDRLLMAVSGPEVLEQVAPYLGRAKPVEGGREVKRVMIAGATRVGVHLARLLEQSKRDVVLIERDPTLARMAGERLSTALVVQGNATDRKLLVAENVDTFDAFVGATANEEHNVLAALMAKQFGVDMAVALIHQPELKGFLETINIDLAVAPRLSTVGAILKHTHKAEELALQVLGEEAIYVYRVPEGAPAIGKAIRKLPLPENAVIAAIVRDGKAILPRGDDQLQAEDRAVVFCTGDVTADVERLLT
ncbi:MAG TPA: Trk system potassium transporter TrkA [Candidatus Thermoplasmatota archaeon]|nr:Trk system potassium transporter TrkA [Candidatus Thermoplasmatota archaeon]